MLHEREFEFSMEQFNELAGVIYDLTGIVLKQQKYNMLYARLTRRLRQLGFSDFSQYIELVKGSTAEEELSSLVNAVTTNLTRFFREKHHFRHMRNEVLRPLVNANKHIAGMAPSKKIRVWSAGCSTGEEPYTVAMTLAASIPNIETWDVKILATDIDANVLTTSKNGRYNQASVDTVPSVLAERFFHDTEDETLQEVDASLKEMINFAHLNLMGDWPIKTQFDIIFCRNVLIYFDKAAHVRLVKEFKRHLKPGGLLCLGHAEALTAEGSGLTSLGQSMFQKSS